MLRRLADEVAARAVDHGRTVHAAIAEEQENLRRNFEALAEKGREATQATQATRVASVAKPRKRAATAKKAAAGRR